MLRSISYQQLREWQTFAELEPFGEKRMDYRFASIVQTLANINRNPDQRVDAYTLEECVLKFGDAGESKPPEKKRTPWQMMKMMAQAAAVAFNPNAKNVKPGE